MKILFVSWNAFSKFEFDQAVYAVKANMKTKIPCELNFTFKFSHENVRAK